MSENIRVRMFTEKEIENLAKTQAEKEAFVKSTIVFVLLWAAGFVILPFIKEGSYRIINFVVSVRVLCVAVSFFVAFAAGLITRWVVKDSAYEKFYRFYKEQQKQSSS